MRAPNTDKQYEAFAREHVRRRVAKLVRALRFPDGDGDDLEQEILLYVYQCLPKYDEARGSIEAFTNKVVTSKIRNIMDPRTARMRELSLTGYSLDESARSMDGEGITRLDMVDSRACRGSYESIETYSSGEIELKVDIDRLISRLPPILRDLCNALKWGNITDASEELQINRREVARKMHKLRGLFAQYWSEPDMEKVAHFFEFVCKD